MSKEHLDIEVGDLCVPVKGNSEGRVGVVLDVRYNRRLKDTLEYTLFDESTHEFFTTVGAVLRLLQPDYLSKRSDVN